MNISKHFQKDPAQEIPLIFGVGMLVTVGVILSGSLVGGLVCLVLLYLDYRWQMAGNWDMKNEDADHDGVSAREYHFGGGDD